MSIEERQQEVENRDRPGADGDLIVGAKYKVIVPLVENCTGFTLILKIPFKAAECTKEAICKLLSSVRSIFKSHEFDSGRE